jgi:hypothetical protein
VRSPPLDPFALSTSTLRRGVSKGPDSSAFGGADTGVGRRLRAHFDTRR